MNRATIMKFKNFLNFILTLILSAWIISGSYVFASNIQLFSFSSQFSKSLPSNPTKKIDIISVFNLIEENEKKEDNTSHSNLGLIPSSSYNNISRAFQKIALNKLNVRFSTSFKNKLNILNCSFLI